MSDDTHPPREPKRSAPGRRPNFAGKGGAKFRGGRPPGRGPAQRRGPGDWPEGRTVLYGWHPVAEALRNPHRRPLRLLVTENAQRRLEEEFGTLALQPEVVSANEISTSSTSSEPSSAGGAGVRPMPGRSG